MVFVDHVYFVFIEERFRGGLGFPEIPDIPGFPGFPGLPGLPDNPNTRKFRDEELFLQISVEEVENDGLVGEIALVRLSLYNGNELVGS